MTQQILNEETHLLANWFTYEEVKKIFNYKSTKMAQLLKNPYLKVAVIDGRKFVHKESIERLLESKSNKPIKLRK